MLSTLIEAEQNLCQVLYRQSVVGVAPLHHSWLALPATLFAPIRNRYYTIYLMVFKLTKAEAISWNEEKLSLSASHMKHFTQMLSMKIQEVIWALKRNLQSRNAQIRVSNNGHVSESYFQRKTCQYFFDPKYQNLSHDSIRYDPRRNNS